MPLMHILKRIYYVPSNALSASRPQILSRISPMWSQVLDWRLETKSNVTSSVRPPTGRAKTGHNMLPVKSTLPGPCHLPRERE
jgi:hypothetical protein